MTGVVLFSMSENNDDPLVDGVRVCVYRQRVMRKVGEVAVMVGVDNETVAGRPSRGEAASLRFKLCLGANVRDNSCSHTRSKVQRASSGERWITGVSDPPVFASRVWGSAMPVLGVFAAVQGP